MHAPTRDCDARGRSRKEEQARMTDEASHSSFSQSSNGVTQATMIPQMRRSGQFERGWWCVFPSGNSGTSVYSRRCPVNNLRFEYLRMRGAPRMMPVGDRLEGIGGCGAAAKPPPHTPQERTSRCCAVPGQTRCPVESSVATPRRVLQMAAEPPPPSGMGFPEPKIHYLPAFAQIAEPTTILLGCYRR